MRTPRTIAVVTGSRAEFGLLRPVMRAIRTDPQKRLRLQTIVTGTHLLPPARTLGEVAAEFDVDAAIPMQHEGETGRPADAAALGRGISGFALRFAQATPDVVLVLGDRIEAFAAAAAACVAGIRIAHMHGGDRAEGIVDESLRHAISKMAHIHLPATQQSADRLIKMGEDPQRVHVVGSPAIDGLDAIAPLDDAAFESLGSPRIIVLLHPESLPEDQLEENALRLLKICSTVGPVLALEPNHDPGRDAIMRAIQRSGCAHRAHLPREQFIGLLRRCGVLAGNSSAGLIECAALSVRCANIGSRQRSRETPGNVTDVPEWDFNRVEAAIRRAVDEAARGHGQAAGHPYGDGRTGLRTARVLADFDPAVHSLAKRNSY